MDTIIQIGLILYTIIFPGFIIFTIVVASAPGEKGGLLTFQK